MLAFLQDKFSALKTSEAPYNWASLGLLNLYRLGLSGLLLLATMGNTPPLPLGGSHPETFFTFSVIYVVFTIFSALALLRRWPQFHLQLYAQVLLDILFITLMMHTSGGISSGISMLLVVDIAAGGILTTGRAAVIFAAVATVATFIEQIFAYFGGTSNAGDYAQVGMLGATFFATALLAQLLARRTSASETLSAQRATDLDQMAQLTEYIIERMQTGIIVLGSADEISLMNESAWHLLGTLPSTDKQPLALISPELARQIVLWRHSINYVPTSFRPTHTAADLLPRFATLGREHAGTLIFLEDTSSIAQQAQHLKVASLLKLTGSIAHEIRNPLAAISHAGQLLEESDTLDHGDARLIQIICMQSQRMNRIIENMLQISRRQRSRLEDFPLTPWLDDFVSEFTRSHQIDAAQIAVEHALPTIGLRMDPSQLHQILWNLCENGLRYADKLSLPKLKLRSGIMLESNAPFLDVIDTGCGIDDALAARIFDPFFTTEEAGTGLGLYIARELCECNQARLGHVPLPGSGTCFRITFADPRRWQAA